MQVGTDWHCDTLKQPECWFSKSLAFPLTGRSSLETAGETERDRERSLPGLTAL